MNRPVALTWLALTLVPLAYILYLTTFSTLPKTTSTEEARAYFDLMFRLGAAVVIEYWLLVASYIIYVFKTRHVPPDKKALWAAVLFFGSLWVANC